MGAAAAAGPEVRQADSQWPRPRRRANTAVCLRRRRRLRLYAAAEATGSGGVDADEDGGGCGGLWRLRRPPQLQRRGRRRQRQPSRLVASSGHGRATTAALRPAAGCSCVGSDGSCRPACPQEGHQEALMASCLTDAAALAAQRRRVSNWRWQQQPEGLADVCFFRAL